MNNTTQNSALLKRADGKTIVVSNSITLPSAISILGINIILVLLLGIIILD